MSTDFLNLSPDQDHALRAMESGASMFLTGGAGVGKSALINEFVRRHPRTAIARLASTGAAAQLIGGQTVHSFFGLMPGIHSPHDLRMPDRIRQRIRGVKTLIIDEISQLRVDVFQAVRDRLFGAARGYGPFAGYQVICVGDFCQIPPVLTERDRNVVEHLYGERAQFAFQSRHWEGLQTFELTTIHRQSADLNFAAWLNQVRSGEVPDLSVVNARVGEPPAGSVHLVSTNRMAHEINDREMAKIEGGRYRIVGAATGDYQERDMRVPENLTLKPGARIIICANDPKKEFANGSTGTLIACERDQTQAPVARVRLDSGREVVVRQHLWEVVDYQSRLQPGGDGKPNYTFERVVTGSYKQLPILPGWAITIHRSQGMSIDNLHVDTRGVFEAGQAYVALSRATRLSGLTLAAPIKPEMIITDDRVAEFNQRFSRAAAPEMIGAQP